jgi:ABC-2 type transport system permease protein
MHKVWFVVRHEYERRVFKPGFLLPLLSVPVLVAVILGVSVLGRVLRSDSPERVGYVDPSGLLAGALAQESASQDSVLWVPFQTNEAAQAALEGEQILAYYVLRAEDGGTPQVELVYAQQPSRTATEQIAGALRAHLLAGQPPEIARRVAQGNTFVVRSPGAAPGSAREFSDRPTLGQLLPALSGFVLVVLILISSGYLMNAVADEKTNRTMEILLSSIPPGRLMAGKIVAIGGVMLTQFVAWSVLSGLLVALGGNVLGLAWLRDLRVDPPTLGVALVVVIPSYVMVAALMLALGASLADTQTSQQITMALVSFYLTPMVLVVAMLRTLHNPLMIGLSILPLTAPVVLPLRAAFTNVPAWQTAASVAVQVLCAAAALWLAGRTLRLGMLRYGRRIRWRELFGSVAPALADSRRTIETGGAWRAGRTSSRAPGRNKTLPILRHELVTAVTKPVFLLTCVGLPLLVFGQLAVMEAAFRDEPVARGQPGGAAAAGTEASVPEAASERHGVVDQSGLIQALPDPMPGGTLVPYADEASARQALKEGHIAAYVIVPADYLASGQLICVRRDYSPLADSTCSGAIEWALLVNLLGGDQALAAQVREPMHLQQAAWAPAAQAGGAGSVETEEEEGLARLMPMLIMLLLYGVVVMASGLLLSSVSEEKKSRVIEILLASVHPRQLLAGKIIALGIVGLLQAVVWGGMGYALLTLSGRMLRLPAGIELPPSLLAWGVVFSMLGYALYATLTAGAGALVPDLKQSPMVSLVIMAPALVGFYIGLMTSDAPHGALATGASLFPLTAPFVMIQRLVGGGVPFWQPVLAVVLMLLTLPLVMRAVARMFHAQNLLSGQPFSIKRYLRALLGWA